MLHVTTARGILGWATWREAYESVMHSLDAGTELPPSQGSRILESLAHVEVVSVNGHLKVAAAPAVLARLPRAGLPVAVLCGGRSPQTERKLREAANANSARFIAVPSAAERHRPPRAFLVEAEDLAHLSRTATAAGIQFAELPPAWSLVHSVGNLDGYLSSLAWRHEPEPNLSATDFDVSSMRLARCNQRARAGASCGISRGGCLLTSNYETENGPLGRAGIGESILSCDLMDETASFTTCVTKQSQFLPLRRFQDCLDAS